MQREWGRLGETIDHAGKPQRIGETLEHWRDLRAWGRPQSTGETLEHGRYPRACGGGFGVYHGLQCTIMQDVGVMCQISVQYPLCRGRAKHRQPTTNNQQPTTNKQKITEAKPLIHCKAHIIINLYQISCKPATHYRIVCS